MAVMAVSPKYPINAIWSQFHEACSGFGLKNCSSYGFLNSNRPFVTKFKKTRWYIMNSLDSNGLDSSSSNGGGNGATRLIRAIQALRDRLGSRIREIRKGFPVKLLFFLAGFYCATAFATMIGQTGDWDILSAALTVVVVEGIGALMYGGSFPFVDKIKSVITVFNYWKTGLALGLFLDSFKYELDDVFGFSNPFPFSDIGFDPFSAFL